MPKKIEPLEALARTMVGDGKSPNVFFVTDDGVVVTITRNFGQALNEWRRLATSYPRRESALEDRKFGVIASVAPESDEKGAKLVSESCVGDFVRFHPQYKSEVGQ